MIVYNTYNICIYIYIYVHIDCLFYVVVLLNTRLRDLIEERQTRFISSLCVEEMFHSVKSHVASSSNSRCTPARAMAHLIDDKMMSITPNHFDVIDIQDAPESKISSLGPDTFQAPLQQKRLPVELQNAKLNDIVGRGAATWWSPGPTLIFKPHAEILAMRVCKKDGDLYSMKYAWLSKLCFPKLLIRRKGTFTWQLCLGDLARTLVKTWQVEFKNGLWHPVCRAGSVASDVVITNLKDWEAISLKPVSPLHAAIKTELGILHGQEKDVPVQLNEDIHYNKICIGASQLDVPRQLGSRAMLSKYKSTSLRVQYYLLCISHQVLYIYIKY